MIVKMQRLFLQDGDNDPEQGSTIRTGRHVFSAKGTQCDSPGQRPGKMRNECPKPQRGERIVSCLRPVRAFLLKIACFLGQCPRLSHGAALRQNPSDTPAVVTEQKPDQQTTPINLTFAQPRPDRATRVPAASNCRNSLRSVRPTALSTMKRGVVAWKRGQQHFYVDHSSMAIRSSTRSPG